MIAAEISDPLVRELALIRMARGMTQQALADTAGVTIQLISRAEAGIHSPTLRTLRKICEGLGVDLAVVSRASPSPDGAGSPNPSKCGEHQDVADSPPCRPCEDARRTHDLWETGRSHRTKARQDAIAAAVDPNGEMSPEDREKAVRNAISAHYRRMALKSHEARRANRAAK